MARRRAEPDPETWWDRYGHRVQRRAGDHPDHAGRPDTVQAARPNGQSRPDPEPPPAAEPSPRDGSDAASGPPTMAEETIVRGRVAEPRTGWRGMLLRGTGGRVNPGPSAAEQDQQVRLHRIRRPVERPRRVAVSSLKGGVGKTTVTTCLGLVFAEHRGDRVVVLDANPDAGTLADRLTGESGTTLRDMIDDLDGILSWTDMARYTSLAGRLQVLASEQDPAASRPVNRHEYERVCAVLDRYFNIVITDSGTGLVHSAMEGTLTLADSLIVVGAPTVDGAGRASKTLDWLLARPYGHLVEDAVVVLSCDRRSRKVDLTAVRDHFASRCRAVVEIPHDPHLAVGGRVDLERLRPATREAFYDLAALVADGF